MERGHDNLALDHEHDEETREAAIAAALFESRRMDVILRTISPEKRAMATRIAATLELRRATSEAHPEL